MSIPLNPVPSEEEEAPENMIQGEDTFPPLDNEPKQETSLASEETVLISNEILPVEDPAEETALSLPEESAAESSAVVESTYTDLDEPGEMVEGEAPAKPPKPAYIAILTIIGLLILCCVMGGVMFLLLRNEIFATGVL